MTKNPKTKADELREALRKKHQAPLPSGEVPPETRGGGSTADHLTDQTRAAEEEAKGHYDKLLRVMAEFENFKKRMAREHEEGIKYANEKLLKELIPSLDDLDRVLDHIPPDASNEVRAIADGIDLMRKSLLTVLNRFGLAQVPALGIPFDPVHHEAIAVVPSEAHEPGHVIAVHREGYLLGERLLRSAMVTVAQETAKDAGTKA